MVSYEHKYYSNEGPQQLISYQQRLNDITSSTLLKIINIFELEFTLKLCCEIIMFMDDMDLCQMSNNSSLAGQLFHIYWILSPQKLTFDRKFGFTDFNLLHSLKWIDNGTNWCIKQLIDNDIMIENYLSKNYLKMTWINFMKEVKKYVNDTNTNFAKLLKLLKVVIDKDNIKYCEVLKYNQYAWRELGGPPSICSKGMYFIFNLPILQRSYCFNIDNKILDK